MDRSLLEKINKLNIPNFLYYYGDFNGNILYVKEKIKLIDPEYISDYQKLQYELANLYLHSKSEFLINESILYLEKHDEVYVKYDNKYLYCPDGILKIEILSVIKGEPNNGVLKDLIGKINGPNRYKTPQRIWSRNMLSSIDNYFLPDISQREVEKMLDRDIKIDFLGNNIILNKDNYRQLLTGNEMDPKILGYLKDQIKTNGYEEIIGRPKIESKSTKSSPLFSSPPEKIKRSIPPPLNRDLSISEELPPLIGSYTKFSEQD